MTGHHSSEALFRMIMLAVLVFLLPVACRGKNPEIKNPEILGAWQGGGQTVELFRSGEIILHSNWGTKQSTGTYEFVDEDTVHVTFKGSLPQDYIFSLSGDNMIVTRTDGSLIGEYKRVTQAKAR